MARKTKESNSFQISSYVNLIVGVVVVIAVAALIIGLVRSGKVKPQPTQNQTQQAKQTSLPTKHTVAEGEDLWSISEKYYKTGYNWTDIAQANNLSNPNAIEKGMELTIPDVSAKTSDQQLAQGTATPSATQIPSPTTTQTEKSTESSETSATPTPVPTTTAQPDKTAVSGNSYTVVAGDDLWDIAVRAYGDGYKWVEIARANKLENPNIIHPGNVFTLPR